MEMKELANEIFKNLLPFENTFNLYKNNGFFSAEDHLSSFVKLKVDGPNIMSFQRKKM